MKNNKKKNYIKLILGCIPYFIPILIGLGIIAITVFAGLQYYGVINLEHFNVSSFDVFSTLIFVAIAFCFIFFPLRSIIRELRGVKIDRVGEFKIASQTVPEILIDKENEHNRKVKSLGEEKTIIHTKRKERKVFKSKSFDIEKVQIIFLSCILLIFGGVAILLFLNKEIGIGIFVLSMIFPFLLWLISMVRERVAKKKNKEIKESVLSKYKIIFSILIPLTIGPFALLDGIKNVVAIEAMKKYYLPFACLLLGVGFLGLIYDSIRLLKNKKLLKNEYLAKNKGRYIGCKFSSSTDQTFNGIPTKSNVKYKIKFGYIDERGIPRKVTSLEEYTFKEVAYLKNKNEFDILSHKRDAMIVEDLSNIDILEEKNIDLKVKRKTSKSFSLPLFARKNIWLYGYIASLLIVAIFVTSVILLFVKPSGNNIIAVVQGLIALLIFGVSTYFFIPKILSVSKGQEVYGTLLELKVTRIKRRNHSNNRLFAVVLVDGEKKDIPLIFNQWFAFLGEYVGDQIPLKKYKKTIIIDFQKMYTDKI